MELDKSEMRIWKTLLAIVCILELVVLATRCDSKRIAGALFIFVLGAPALAGVVWIMYETKIRGTYIKILVFAAFLFVAIEYQMCPQ